MKAIILSLMMLMGANAFAQVEHGNGGGEDGIFKGIRNEVGDWLSKNNALGVLSKKLELKNITSEILLNSFNQSTKDVGDKIIFNHDEIRFENNIRICKNDQVTKIITCNLDEWSKTKGDTRYMIVFHEYLGIAGIETNVAEYSTYPISPKILEYVHAKNAYELGMEKTSPVSNNFVDKVKTLFSQQGSISIPTMNNQGLRWTKCVGVYLTGSGMTGQSSGSIKPKLTGKVRWEPFPEREEFSFTKIAEDFYQVDSFPNLPYSPNLPVSSTLVGTDTFLSIGDAFTITVKVLNSNSIVAEAALNNGMALYDDLYPITGGTSVSGQDVTPFAYFTCSNI